MIGTKTNGVDQLLCKVITATLALPTAMIKQTEKINGNGRIDSGALIVVTAQYRAVLVCICKHIRNTAGSRARHAS